MKLHLTYVNRTTRTAKATGKPFESVSIKAGEYGNEFIGGFGNKDNASWKVGDEVEVAEVKKDPTGKYWNFEMPKASKSPVETIALHHEIKVVQGQLASIIDHLSGNNRLDRTSDGSRLPNFDGESADDDFDVESFTRSMDKE